MVCIANIETESVIGMCQHFKSQNVSSTVSPRVIASVAYTQPSSEELCCFVSHMGFQESKGSM